MALSEFSKEALAASGTAVKDAQKNATAKQYNVKAEFVITESNGNKAFFDGGVNYTGVPYGFVVAIEAEMTKLIAKLTTLGGEIATGGELPPP